MRAASRAASSWIACGILETTRVNRGVPQRAVDDWMGDAPDRSMASIYYKLNDDEPQAPSTLFLRGSKLAADAARSSRRCSHSRSRKS